MNLRLPFLIIITRHSYDIHLRKVQDSKLSSCKLQQRKQIDAVDPTLLQFSPLGYVGQEMNDSVDKQMEKSAATVLQLQCVIMKRKQELDIEEWRTVVLFSLVYA